LVIDTINIITEFEFFFCNLTFTTYQEQVANRLHRRIPRTQQHIHFHQQWQPKNSINSKSLWSKFIVILPVLRHCLIGPCKDQLNLLPFQDNFAQKFADFLLLQGIVVAQE
jgi:hypothetical protein